MIASDISQRDLVFARDGHACVKCGGDEALTLDHIQPRAKGGGNQLWNLQTLCFRCNGKKGDSIRWSARRGHIVRRAGRA